METKDLFKEMIEKAGFKVGMHSDECALYRAEHSNCFGCEYELGCAKLAAIKLLQVQSLLYAPKNFDDFLEKGKRVAEITAKIIKASTTDEIKSLV